MRALLPVLLLMVTPATALADVTYYSYKSIRDWRVPGGDTTIVLAFTVLFGATVWFLARGIWLRDRVAQRRNLVLAVLTFVPAIALALIHAQRS